MGYRVNSGPWPFYRLCVFFLFLGAVMQVFYGPPLSVEEGLPHGFFLTYTITMLVGTFFIFFPIQFMRQNLLALYTERFGLWIFGGSVLIYLLNYFYTTGIPRSPQTMVFFAFLIYPIFRIRQLGAEIDETIRQREERLSP